ncbi:MULTISPECIES: LysR family transcriptional regulator [Hyphomicrobiales]|uniref:LysR family transcriptional regulator n=1 Tax=Manganibacter manganicus TaxID=1873176 RepID=A0A1V8RJB7_9HYPH|nr:MULTISPECIES: LysR family transcriptional regulator [Hyphomicrobiales]MAM11013.1 LysR family transcriptional regulator [Rhizobiaceae bacterium]OQM73305.1 LysR family transcriptional regulator [Pseudaminobacter manganicus]RAI37344.1 LysR family transcriptional regulator [Rhodoplanes serenus]
MAKSFLSGIELRHLRYFVAAAEHGSFRKAGVAIGVGEPAISRRIRDLEDHLGAALFHRHSGGVGLTFAGKRFLRLARQIIRNLGEGAQDVAALGRSECGSVKIGIFSSIASGFLTELLRDYGQHHASVRVELIDGNPEEHVAAIRQLSLDVAFLTGVREWSDCDRIHLWTEKVFAVLQEDHPLAASEELTWRDLVQEPFIVSETAPGQEVHDYLVHRLADLGRHPDIRRQGVGRDNLFPLVGLGKGMTLTSESTTAATFPGITYRPIAGEVLPFSAVWSAKNDNPALRRLLSLAKSISKRNGLGL